MALKVKIFEGNSLTILEDDINEFLAQFRINDVKVVSISTSEKLFYIIIFYNQL